MRMLARFAGLIGAVIITLVWGAHPALGQTHLSADEAGRVDEVIKVLEQKADFLAHEPGANPDFVKRFGNSVAALRRVFNTKEGKEDHDRMWKGGMPDGVGGHANGPGQELDADGKPVPPDKKPSQGKNEIQLEPPIVGPGAKDCNPMFIRLLDVLLHEATHLNQLPSTLPVDADGLKKATDTPEHAKETLDKKIAAIDNELQAYEDEVGLKNQIIDALLAIQADPATAPAWASHWLNCPQVMLDIDTNFALGERDPLNGKQGIVPQLMKLKAKYLRLDREGKESKADLVFELDRNEVYKHFVAAGASAFIGLDSGDSRIRIDGFGGGSILLDSGIPHPQDAIVFEAAGGHFKLLVCGVTDFDHPQGIIRLFDMPNPGGTAGGPASDPTVFPLGSVPYTTLCATNPFLIHPTSLVAAPGGRAYVWDVAASALYAMTDSDADGVPDQVDLTRSLVRIPRGFDLRHLSTLSFVNGGIVVGWRIGVPLDGGDPVVFNLRDETGDGFFETVRPTRLSRLLKAAGHH